MITFIISLAVLILGYLFYGRFVERVFGPDDELVFDEVLKQINN
jgi:carbon starvation protein CstA